MRDDVPLFLGARARATFHDFAQAYRAARLQEGWEPLSPSQALLLPFGSPPGYPQLYWQVRRQTFRRLVRMLEKEGHTVTVAANGRLALEALAEGGYDLVLMDVQMPEMGGLEATAQIRSGEEATGDHIPIVGLTANAMKSDEEACLAAGMDAFLAKPLRRQRLVEVLASVEAPPAPEPGSAAADVDDTPVVDGSMLDELRELEAEGAFSLREVVEIFETEAEPRLAAIGAALAAGNGPDLKREAHTLKGSARDLGALRLVAVCQEMEDRGGADRFDGAEALLEGIAVELAAARAELTALLE